MSISADMDRSIGSRADLRWGFPGAVSFSLSLFIFFLLDIASLFATTSIVLVLLAAFSMLFAHPTSTLVILRREALLLFPPALSIVSTLWSKYPEQTFYYGLQFLLVVIIAINMAYWHRAATIIGHMAASFSYLFVSSVASNKVAWLNQGSSIEIGINGGKNYIGGIALTGGLASCYAIQYGLRTRRLWPVGLGCLCLAMGLVAIVAAHASGALVSIATCILLFFGLQWLSRQPPDLRAKMLVTVSPVVTLSIIYSYEIWEAILRLFNKSADLTGRTFIWGQAEIAIGENPFLGWGFNGFWVVGNPNAEVIWKFGGIDGKSGFNFHNTFLEFAVAFGLPLAIVLVLVFLLAAARKIAYTLKTGDPAVAFGTVIVIDWLTHAFFESGGIGTFTSQLLLLYMAFSGTRIPRLELGVRWRQGRRPSQQKVFRKADRDVMRGDGEAAASRWPQDQDRDVASSGYSGQRGPIPQMRP